ncbi:hypothetical protein [Agrococcus sp. HG114]|uniref:hypothetical protein n=1 Tax=Agrococcus sp. HG114 TaxID=2969757 RepID=UPI00215B063E|nr:hypothetical protein [Agrococcus sp. HG114]MCR8670852.1 hypothetical protein [Agrococcus sp. HG114]
MGMHILGRSDATDGTTRPDRDPSLVRLRRDAYVDAEAWAAAHADERFRARVRAVAATRSAPVFALQAGLALEGLPFGVAPDVVATIGGMSTSGRRSGVAHTHVALDDADVVAPPGEPARLALPYLLADVARRLPQHVAVSALDAALAAGRVEREALQEALARQSPRGRRRAAWVIGFADGRSESPGESLSRVTIHRIGAPRPDLQVRVRTAAAGDRWLDFCWQRPGRRPLAGEFDGALKYGIVAQRSSRSGVDALVEEKRREDALRETHDVARWMWADALAPLRLRALLVRHGLPVGRRVLPGW